MKFEIERKTRNYNFLELIKGFNYVLNSESANKSLTKSDEYLLTGGLIGESSIDKIIDALYYDFDNPESIQTTNLGLIDKNDNGDLVLAKNKKIQPPPTKEEVAYIKYLLDNGSLGLYLNKAETEVLSKNIDTYFKNINLQIPNISSHFIIKGKSNDNDSLFEIKDKFEHIKKIIDSDKSMMFSYFYNGKSAQIVAKPKSFLFSQLDERFRVKAQTKTAVKTFYLRNMSDIKESDTEFNNAFCNSKKELVFTCKNEANTIERITARFSDYEKTVHHNSKKDVVEYHIFYEDNPQERNRILIRLRYLITRINIISSERDIIKSEAKESLENYKKGYF